jgi:DNA-binding Lrp family transcriptional regulator
VIGILNNGGLNIDRAKRQNFFDVLRNGELRISAIVQEIGFTKPALIERLRELLPDEKIRDLKLRVGPIT